MAKESSQHTGHRQRMRARVEQYGLESLEPHEALEYVLYITNTRKDTNGLAHVLIDRFGDFAGVLDASEEDLLTVEGVAPLPPGCCIFCRRSADTIPSVRSTEKNA